MSLKQLALEQLHKIWFHYIIWLQIFFMIAKVKKVCFKSTQLSRIGPYPVAATNLSLADFSRLTVTDKHCFKKDHKMFGQGPNSIIMYIFFLNWQSNGKNRNTQYKINFSPTEKQIKWLKSLECKKIQLKVSLKVTYHFNQHVAELLQKNNHSWSSAVVLWICPDETNCV